MTNRQWIALLLPFFVIPICVLGGWGLTELFRYPIGDLLVTFLGVWIGLVLLGFELTTWLPE